MKADGWGGGRHALWCMFVITIFICSAEQNAATGPDSFASAFDELDSLTKKSSASEASAGGDGAFMNALGQLDAATKREQSEPSKEATNQRDDAPKILPPPKQTFRQYDATNAMEAAVALEEAHDNHDTTPSAKKAKARPAGKTVSAKKQQSVKTAVAKSPTKQLSAQAVVLQRKKPVVVEKKEAAAAVPKAPKHEDPKVWKAAQAMKAAMHSKAKAQVLSAAKAVKVEETESEVTLTSTIELRSIWAFLGIISLLVGFTVLFEHGKETLQEHSRGTPSQPIVEAIFGELTVLGFLALLTFLIGKFGLAHVSTMIYGRAEAEDRAKLGESLEQIHMVIFMCMVIFVAEALGMLWNCSRHSSDFEGQNSELYKFSHREKLLKDYEEHKKEQPGCVEKLLGLTEKAKEANKLEFDVPFMLIREEFIHDEQSVGTSLQRDFAFHLYITKILGMRLASVVALPVSQWIALEVVVLVLLISFAATGGEWQFIFWVWMVIPYLLLGATIMFWKKVKNVFQMMSHNFDNVNLCKMEKSLCKPSKVLDQQQTEGIGSIIAHDTAATGEIKPADVEADAAATGDEDKPADAPDAPTDATPLVQQQAGAMWYDVANRSYTTEETAIEVAIKTEKNSEQRKWIKNKDSTDSQPRFMVEEATPPPCCVPKWLRGDYLENPNCSEAKRRMYDQFWFGSNEEYFHVSFLRFIFLVQAVYCSIFFIQIVPAFVAKVYPVWAIILIIAANILPAVLIYFKFIFEAILYSVIVTSIESMRNRQMVEWVLRHQKEAAAVSMLRLVVAMNTLDTLQDKASIKEVEDSMASTEHSVQLEKLSNIFDQLDEDHSHTLSAEEIREVYKKFGMNISEEKHRQMLDNMNVDKAGEDGAEPSIHRHEFLLWMLLKEKQAQQMDPEEFAKECFNLLDVEGKVNDDLEKVSGGDGKITVSEFHDGLTKLGSDFTWDEVSRLVIELDENQDNFLTEEDLHRWISQHPSTAAKENRQ